MTQHPAECVVKPARGDEAYLFELGRVAFRSPFLLGGLAARTSMRCQTCHVNGHGNPDFFVEGFSDSPGTADATSHLFSHSRGDGVFNPVAIPTLVDVDGKQDFGTAMPVKSLRAFVSSVIVEEFQGRTPDNMVLEGLLAYVRAMRNKDCPSEAVVAVTLDADIAEARTIYGVVLDSLERRQLNAADFAIVSLGAALGRVRRQFPVDTHTPEALVKLAYALQQIRQLLPGDKSTAREALAAWRAQFEAAIPGIEREVERSYYSPAVLEQRLAR